MRRLIFALFLVLVLLSLQSPAAECSRPQGSFRVSSVGDVLVHQALYQEIVESRDRFKTLWADLIPKLKESDFMTANLEGPTAPGVVASGRAVPDPGFVYDGVVYSGTNFLFNYHPSLLADLKASGFDFVSTANNHSLDRGSLGIDRTIDQLLKVDLPFAGTRRRDGLDGDFEVTLISKSYRIGVVACAEMLNGNSDPFKQVLRCGSEAVTRAIFRLSGQTDLVLVFPHWGDEYQLSPNSLQKSLARKWVSAGASAIIGSHPHVLQTVEMIRRSDGTVAPVIYSLGNFVAGQAPMERRATAITHLDFAPTATGLRLIQFSYTPVLRPRGSVAIRRLSSAPSVELAHIEKQLGPTTCQE